MSSSFGFQGPAEIIAHRGYSARAPENTIAALEAALAAGVDAVEFDLHTAADGIPVLFHDAMLSRTTNGVGPLRRRTLGQLQALDAGKWFADAFAGERIPAFRDALEHVGERAARIYAEVKGFREMEDLDRMVQIARECGSLDRIVFIAMNWTLLDRMRSQEPSLQVGYIVEEPARSEEALAKAIGDRNALVDFKAEILLADPSIARQAVGARIPLATWTVDAPEDATRLHSMGVPRITTNQVEALLEWKRGL